MKSTESQIQISMVRWFRYAYPHLALNLFHIPNGRMRTAREGKILKAEGVVSGVADLALMVTRNCPGLFIEVKTEKGRQSASQKLWQKQIEKQGYKYVILRSLDEFIIEIENYLNETNT